MRLVVTGGAGSFGQAFIRLVLREDIRAVRVLSRDEEKHRAMREELADERLGFMVGDVRDGPRLRRAFEGADIVVHAAALKQIPATERDPGEAVKTNVLGAINVAEAAIDARARWVIALSTDKACAPVLLYGASKLCAERYFCQASAIAGSHPIRFACVRYGNVVGSRGSVVPIFLRQAKGGVLTITDPEMTRFWMTLDQAAAFVRERLSDMEDGEIYIPKLRAISVVDLAETIAPNAQQRVIGRRYGEKLHESMIAADEAPRVVDRGDHFAITRQFQAPRTWIYSSELAERMTQDQIRAALVGSGLLAA